MKRFAFTLAITAACAVAQRPSNPALLVPQDAPLLDFAPVPNPLQIPESAPMGASSDVAFDSKGHLWVLNRGEHPLMEFDENGKFLRSMGEGMFTRTHGIRVDKDGNIWVTDVGAHFVVKLSPQGQTLLTLGEKGKAGELRPGLLGVGKVEAGSRSLLWIWTHRISDWLRLTLWSWIG